MNDAVCCSCGAPMEEYGTCPVCGWYADVADEPLADADIVTAGGDTLAA